MGVDNFDQICENLALTDSRALRCSKAGSNLSVAAITELWEGEGTWTKHALLVEERPPKSTS
jgi:hypothetical protein